MRSIHAQRARKILRAVEEESGFTREEILGGARISALTPVRRALVYLIRQELKVTFAEIADFTERSRQHTHRVYDEARRELITDPLFADFVRKVQKGAK